MKKNIHVANTDFEFELASESRIGLKEVWEKNQICLQLQYLPLLYAEPTEGLLVTHLPDPDFLENFKAMLDIKEIPTFVLFDQKEIGSFQSCQSWGWSRRVKQWADSHNLDYPMPPFEVVKEINSKAFSFLHSPKLDHSALLFNQNELKSWLAETQDPKVLKSCFGLSGRGHKFVEEDAINVIQFCEKEWSQGRPVIAEPWVERQFDFSTQWFINQDGTIELLGSTVFESDAKGQYIATLAGAEESIFGSFLSFLETHKQVAFELLTKVAEMGFFGNIGVDAFVYLDEKKVQRLHPIVEINGRRTMSWVALRLYQKHFSTHVVELTFSSEGTADQSLLPSYIDRENKKRFEFGKKLKIKKV